MPSSLLRSGLNAVRDRSLAVAALAGTVSAGGAGGGSSNSGAGGGTGASDADGTVGGPFGQALLTFMSGLAPDSFTDVSRLLFWISACVLLVVLVAMTNPNEASFRAHLTELAFRRHLAHIRSSSNDSESAAGNSGGGGGEGARPIPSTSSSNGHANNPAGGNTSGNGGADTPPIAPFRFANHVAITLRTPSLCFRSYFLFALAFTAPPRPPAYLSDPVVGKPHKHAGAPAPDPVVAYLGILGHWFMLGHVPAFLQWSLRAIRVGRRGDKSRKKSNALDRPGVMEMRAVMPKDESPAGGSGGASGSNAASGSGRGASFVPKLLFKTDSHKDLTDLLPLHSTPSSSIPSVGSGSRRGSLSTLAPPPPGPPQQPDPAAEITSPVLTALKAELATAQSVLVDLQAQLASHDESVAASQAGLQRNLDELRQRRKEDDAERQDLKSKTKTLEDQKRQAESARRDAEKRLKAAEAVRDRLQGKVAAALGEIEDLRGNMELSSKHVKIVKEEGTRYAKETRQAVKDKTKELGDLEQEVTELDTAIEALGKQVNEAEERLKSAAATAEEARKIAPEEEMMLMAAAYEAAASESYLHGQRQNQADSQWASQAAAYMAEAGFPHLDQSYTARPTAAQSGSSGYGHLARAHPNSASYRSLVEKRVAADVSGFEDFGPGARSLATQRTATPPIGARPGHAVPGILTDDAVADDQGSPSTHSASFPKSWLPEGLVRSLDGGASEAEYTGDGDGDESLFASLEDALAQGPEDDTSPITESDESSPVNWPVSADRKVTPTGRFGSTSPPMPTTGSSSSTLPLNSGINSLPSRRWIPTSPSSSEAAFHLFNASRTSTDSLPGGFEAAFAPSASEKKALKWPLLGKSRWSGNGRSISALEEVTASLKHYGGEGGAGGPAPFGLSPPGRPSLEELFNRVPVSPPVEQPQPQPQPPMSHTRQLRTSAHDLWTSHKPFGNGKAAPSGAGGHGHAFGSSRLPSGFGAPGFTGLNEDDAEGVGSNAMEDDHDDAGSHDADAEGRRAGPERKPSFRFFSLRKGGA